MLFLVSLVALTVGLETKYKLVFYINYENRLARQAHPLFIQTLCRSRYLGSDSACLLVRRLPEKLWRIKFSFVRANRSSRTALKCDCEAVLFGCYKFSGGENSAVLSFPGERTRLF